MEGGKGGKGGAATFRICQSTERGVPMVPIGEELPSLSDSTFCADPPAIKRKHGDRVKWAWGGWGRAWGVVRVAAVWLRL